MWRGRGAATGARGSPGPRSCGGAPCPASPGAGGSAAGGRRGERERAGGGTEPEVRPLPGRPRAAGSAPRPPARPHRGPGRTALHGPAVPGEAGPGRAAPSLTWCSSSSSTSTWGHTQHAHKGRESGARSAAPCPPSPRPPAADLPRPFCFPSRLLSPSRPVPFPPSRPGRQPRSPGRISCRVRTAGTWRSGNRALRRDRKGDGRRGHGYKAGGRRRSPRGQRYPPASSWVGAAAVAILLRRPEGEGRWRIAPRALGAPTAAERPWRSPAARARRSPRCRSPPASWHRRSPHR